jgi:hypothetical protein
MAGGQRLISWLHPCSTSSVALNTCTSAHGPHMGHPNWAECDIHPSSKNPTSSSVQLTRPVPTLTPCRVTHPRPTHACICPHTEPSKCPGTFPSSARPYVQCRPICHAVCPISGPHVPCALCPHIDSYTQLRGLALIPFVTLPTKAAPPSPYVGASTRTHSTLPYTFVLASCKRVNPRVVCLVDKHL